MLADCDVQGLIRKAVAGDLTALERLLLAHYAPLSRHIAPRLPRSIQSVVSVEDVLQQTFTEAFRSIGKFEPRSERSFFPWLKANASASLVSPVTERDVTGSGRPRPP